MLKVISFAIIKVKPPLVFKENLRKNDNNGGKKINIITIVTHVYTLSLKIPSLIRNNTLQM